MRKFLFLTCVIAALAGCASEKKEPPFLVVDPTAQIVSDVYIRYAGATHETQSLGGAAYRQSATVFSLNEAEVLDVPTQERTAAAAVAKPLKPKRSSSSQAKAKPKSVSKTKPVKAKSPVPAATAPCPPVQVIIKETVYCKECPN